jgi:FkbM family methyltransferase
MLLHKAVKKARHYYPVLGVFGVVAFAFAKVSGTRPLFKKNLVGIRHPVYVRIGTTDLSVLKQTLIERHYDFSLPITPKVIVDAGANIGLSAVFFANKYPEALILAIEPDRANFNVLERNVAPYPQIKAFQAALWNENKQIRLVDPGTGDHGFQTAEGSGANCQPRGFVPAMTMDALMSKMDLQHIDVLKIDIEGAEKEVFETSAKWIEKIGAIMVELHDHLKPGCRRAFSEATDGFLEEFSKGETVLRLRPKSFELSTKRQ